MRQKWIIHIRQQETNLKQFCLRDFTPAISAISIILQARAIRFPVAIVLPEMLKCLQFEASFGVYIVSDYSITRSVQKSVQRLTGCP